MPATNDENEGALGSFHKLIRQQPQLTMQGYNGLTMFFRNDTQLFMEAKFTTDEDHKFLHKLARETGSGEQAWRKAGVDHCDDKQQCLIEKRKKKEKKAQENAKRLWYSALKIWCTCLLEYFDLVNQVISFEIRDNLLVKNNGSSCKSFCVLL